MLGDDAARRLATTTKTAPQHGAITPRWLARLLPWVPVEAGVYRVNRVREPSRLVIACDPRDDEEVTPSFVDYEAEPREIVPAALTAALEVPTRVSDLYGSPHDQLREQLRLTIEALHERREHELLHHRAFGLLSVTPPSRRITTRSGPPTPDDLDELLSKVWKHPGFFVAHPRAIAAFGRECTSRGVPPPTITLHGSPTLTWRGVPIVPCDKLAVVGEGADARTSIVLLRAGLERRGVVGLYASNLPGGSGDGLAVRFMGVDRRGVAAYLVSLYGALAVLADDAVAVLENVTVGRYHDGP